MADTIVNRRKFIGGLIGMFAAPLIVSAVNIMPVRPWKLPSGLIEGQDYWVITAVSHGQYRLDPRHKDKLAQWVTFTPSPSYQVGDILRFT